MSAPRLQSKVAIITGAGSPIGIGRATAYQFAQNGAHAVFVCDINSEQISALEKDLQRAYPDVRVHGRAFDAADPAAVKDVVDEAVRVYGRLDVFFANAGTSGGIARITETEVGEFEEVMRINALSVFLGIKCASEAMRVTSKEKETAGGSIVATASVAGLRSNAGGAAYSASKAAVVSLVKNAAFELTRTGVRVNAICPGLIETGMTAPVFEAARQRGTIQKVGQLNPSGRGGTADEVARVALFLASDEASYVNGQAWAVDGGLSAGHPFVRGKLA